MPASIASIALRLASEPWTKFGLGFLLLAAALLQDFQAIDAADFIHSREVRSALR